MAKKFLDPTGLKHFYDKCISTRLEKTGNASDVTNAFSKATLRENLKTGEKLSISLGKVMKYFDDLKPHAFSNPVNSGDSDSEADVLAAAYGKRLKEGQNSIKDSVNKMVGESENLHVDLLNGGKKLLIMGDSIANGYGWWYTDIPKSEENDGLFAIWRKKYPNNTYVNIAVNRTTLASAYENTPKIEDQLSQVKDTDYDYIFIICGINDISNCLNTRTERGKFGVQNYWYNNYVHDDFSTTVNAICSLVGGLKESQSKAKIFYVIPPSSSYNIMVYQELFKKLALYAQQYGAYIINCQTFYKNWDFPDSKNYMKDQVHPNEAGYRLMESFIIQCLLQQNQICEQDSKIIYTNIIDVKSNASMADVINELIRFVNDNIGNFNASYMYDHFIIMQESTMPIFLEIQNWYGANETFCFDTSALNGVKIWISYNQTLKRAVFMSYLPMYSQYDMNSGVETIDEIERSGMYMIDPNGDSRLIQWGFLSSPFIMCTADVTYYQWGKNLTVLPQKHITLTQPGNDNIVIYCETQRYNSESDEIQNVKRYWKTTGTSSLIE